MALLFAAFSLASLSAQWLPVLLDTAAKGSGLLLLAAAVAGVLRHASAASRHLVWAAAMIGVLVLPGLSQVLPQWQILPVWFQSSTVAIRHVPIERHAPANKLANPRPISDQAVQSANLDRSPDTRDRLARRGARRVEPASVTAARARHLPVNSSVRRTSPSSPALLVLLVWAAGTLVLGMRLALCRAGLARVARASTQVTAGRVHELLVSLGRDVGISAKVCLLQGDRRAMPMTWGVFRRFLLLPAEAEAWGDERLRAVLLHELAHVKRRDAATRLLVQLGCALHWFNPVAWLAARRVHVESERASDNVVLAHGTKASDYAEHLVRVATGCECHGFAGACAIGMATGKSKLEDRVFAVLNARLSRKGISRWALFVCVLVATTLVVSLAMMHGRQTRVVSVLQVFDRPKDIFSVRRRTDGKTDRAYAIYKETQKQLIRGPFVLSAALRHPGISQLPMVREQGENAVEWLMDELKVVTPPETQMIKVEMAGDDPQQLRRLVDAVVQAYMEQIVQVDRAEQLRMKETLERELLEKTEHYEAAQTRFNQLADGALDIPDDETTKLAQRLAISELSDLSRKKQRIEDQWSEAKRRYEMAQAAIGSGRPADELWIEDELRKDDEYAETKSRLDQLEHQYLHFQEVARPGSAALLRLQQQIDLTKRELEKLKSEKEPRIRSRLERMAGSDEWAAESLLRPLQSETLALEAEVEVLTSEYDRKRTEFSQLSKASVELLAKKRELENLEQFIVEAEKRVNTLRVNLNEPPRVQVLQAARVVE